MNKEKNVRKAFVWNMIGSTSYSVSSFLYLLVVTRFCGVELAGFFFPELCDCAASSDDRQIWDAYLSGDRPESEVPVF
jgi:hypothetical protein